MGSLRVIHDPETSGSSFWTIQISGADVFADDVGSRSATLMEVCAPTWSIFKRIKLANKLMSMWLAIMGIKVRRDHVNGSCQIVTKVKPLQCSIQCFCSLVVCSQTMVVKCMIDQGIVQCLIDVRRYLPGMLSKYLYYHHGKHVPEQIVQTVSVYRHKLMIKPEDLNTPHVKILILYTQPSQQQLMQAHKAL